MTAHRYRLVFGVALLAAAVLVAAYFIHFRARWAVERYERQIVAAGETLSVPALYPPSVPPENNGAPLFGLAMGNIIWARTLLETNAPPAMRLAAPGKAIVGWAQPDVRVEGTNSWAQIEEVLARYQEPLQTVREAAEHQAFDYQLDYLQGFTLLLPHLAPIKRAAQLLTADTLCDLHRADAAAAATNLEAMLGVVRATADERLPIFQLVRIAVAAIAMTATWEFLQSPSVSDEQLAAVQHDWAGVRFIQPAKESLNMERAMNLMTLQRMRRSSAQFQQMVGMGGGGPPASGLSLANLGETLLRETVEGARRTTWRVSASYTDQLRALQGYQALLGSLRAVQDGQPFVPVFKQQEARLAALQAAPRERRYEFALRLKRFRPENPFFELSDLAGRGHPPRADRGSLPRIDDNRHRTEAVSTPSWPVPHRVVGVGAGACAVRSPRSGGWQTPALSTAARRHVPALFHWRGRRG